MHKEKRITGYRVFSILNTCFMLVMIFITAYPVYYVVIASFSDPDALARHTGALWLPLEPFTFSAYEMVFDNPNILIGFKNTLFVLIMGLIVNMVMTSLGAFFLAMKGPRLKGIVTYMVIFTMYFSGGMIPAYLNIKDLGLYNSLWSLILPGAIGTTNMIILKSAFQAVPDSLVESARLDGARYSQILTKIMLPLSKATLAVLVLYYGVSHWNSWFSASIYLQSSSKFPLQLILRNILNYSQTSSMIGDVDVSDIAKMADMIKYALIVVTTAPILAIYPFIQKYFTKGVMIGAIKG